MAVPFIPHRVPPPAPSAIPFSLGQLRPLVDLERFDLFAIRESHSARRFGEFQILAHMRTFEVPPIFVDRKQQVFEALWINLDGRSFLWGGNHRAKVSLLDEPARGPEGVSGLGSLFEPAHPRFHNLAASWDSSPAKVCDGLRKPFILVDRPFHDIHTIEVLTDDALLAVVGGFGLAKLVCSPRLKVV